VLVCVVAFVAYRWSDAVWEESAERDLLPAGQRAQAAAAAPVEIA
jgi:hypothetical protein